MLAIAGQEQILTRIEQLDLHTQSLQRSRWRGKMLAIAIIVGLLLTAIAAFSALESGRRSNDTFRAFNAIVVEACLNRNTAARATRASVVDGNIAVLDTLRVNLLKQFENADQDTLDGLNETFLTSIAQQRPPPSFDVDCNSDGDVDARDYLD